MKDNNKQSKLNISQSNKTNTLNIINNLNPANHKENNNQGQNLTNSSNPNAKNNLFEEAAKKLKVLEKAQKESERYFKARDANENKLKLLESNLKKRVLLEKKANNTLDEKTIEKISEILIKISELDPNQIKYFDQPKKNIETQTEEEDVKNLTDKLNKLEKENESLHAKKLKFKSEIEILKNEISNLHSINEKQAKELKNLQVNFEEISSQKSDIEIKLKELTRYNENLLENVKKHDKLIKEYNELKSAMEDSIKLEREKYEYEENKRNCIYSEFKGNFISILQMDILNEITVYLPCKDIGNIIRVCKNVYYSFKNNKECVKNYYINLILLYKKKLNQMNNYDVKTEYKIRDSEIERLFKEHLTNKKQIGKELKPLISKAINFINRDVKTHLGMKIAVTPKKIGNNINSGNMTPKSENTSILGGLGNFLTGSLFSGATSNILNSQQQSGNNSVKRPQTNPISRGELENSIDSINSSRGMSFVSGNHDNHSELDRYDKALLGELAAQKEEIIDFEFNTPDEIRIILNKFLKSDMPTEKLTAFIKEVCLEYSELLFFSYKLLNDIREIELVKYCLNERFKRLNKICFQLESEISEYKVPNRFVSKTTLDGKHENLEELKFKLTNKENDINVLKDNLEATQKIIVEIKSKEDQTRAEYDNMRTLYSKEIRLLKFDLEEMTKQRDQLKNFIIDFKNQINIYNVLEN